MDGRSFARLFLIVACVGLLSVVCGGQGKTPPSGVLTGTWAGAVVESSAGTGTARLVLDQRDAVVSGTFTTTFSGVVSREGPVSGTVNGATLTMFFTPAAPLVCGPGVTLSGTLSVTLAIAGSRLTGSYAGLTCGGATTGTLDLTQGP